MKTTSCASTPRRRSAWTFAHGTPAVFTGQWTTRSGRSAKIDAVGLYCEGYLTKPVRIDDLQQKIEKILSVRKL